jgi:uncharacterized protein (DUF952 family)
MIGADMLAQHVLLHVTTGLAWADTQGSSLYLPEGFSDEGFIHCCHRDQLEGVLGAYFAEAVELTLLVVDPALLASVVRHEGSTNGLEYPHIYGPIDTAAVTEAIPISRREGVWVLPP